MTVVGVTGLMGAGKSLVRAFLLCRGAGSGVCCFDADSVAHDVILRGGAAFDGVVAAFGTAVLGADGEIDRAKLGAAAFGSAGGLETLNGIIHPKVFSLCEEFIKLNGARGVELCVIDVPLLFEAGMDRLCDGVIVVCAPQDLRTRRVVARDGLAADEALRRVSSRAVDPVVFARDGDLAVCNDRSAGDVYETVEKWLNTRFGL